MHSLKDIKMKANKDNILTITELAQDFVSKKPYFFTYTISDRMTMLSEYFNESPFQFAEEEKLKFVLELLKEYAEESRQNGWQSGYEDGCTSNDDTY